MVRAFIVVTVLASAKLATAQYALFAAETYPGSVGGDTSLYGNVERYDFSVSGGAAVPGASIPAATLHDPVGLLFLGGKLFVGNRYGNNLGQGSVQSFNWDGNSVSGGATIATAFAPAAQGFHGFNFAPNGELFVSTVNSGTRRYHDYGSGLWDVSGTASGAVRDAWVSPDGLKLWETTIGNTIVVTNLLPSGYGSSSSFPVAGCNTMHQMAFHNGAIYVAGFNSGTIHKINLDANYNPVSSTIIQTASVPIGIVFSPDGREMYVTGHTNNSIYRFLNVGGNWVPNGVIPTGHSMGYVAIAPEPGIARVRGTISLQEFTAELAGAALVAEVWNGNTLVETLHATVGSGGSFGVSPTESSGTRTLRFRTRSGLKRAVSVTLSGVPTTGVNLSLQNGDVDNSGEVDAIDIDQVIANFGSTGFANADVDGSQEVDAIDIDIVIANFGAVDD